MIQKVKREVWDPIKKGEVTSSNLERNIKQNLSDGTTDYYIEDQDGITRNRIILENDKLVEEPI